MSPDTLRSKIPVLGTVSLLLLAALLVASPAQAGHGGALTVSDSDFPIGDGQSGVVHTFVLTNPIGTHDTITEIVLNEPGNVVNFDAASATGWTAVLSDEDGPDTIDETATLTATAGGLSPGNQVTISITVSHITGSGSGTIGVTGSFPGPPAGNHAPTPTAITVTLDATPPTITATETVDVDGNGFVDGIQFTMSEDILDSTLAAADFAITAPVGPPDYTDNTLGISTGATADDNLFILTVSEEAGVPGDTAVLLGWSFTAAAGKLQDHQLNDAGSDSDTATDGAAPIPLNARAFSDGSGDGFINEISIQFSEPLAAIADSTGFLSDEDASLFSPGTVTDHADGYVDFDVDGTIVGTGVAFNIEYDGSALLADGSGNLLPTFDDLVPEDFADPVIRDIYTVDADSNGILDGLRVEFAETIDASTAASGWAVTGATLDAVATGTGSVDFIILETDEADDLDTADTTPTVDFTKAPGTLEDLAGNQMQDDVGVTVLDGAEPVVLSIETVDAGAPGNGLIEAVLLTLSEDLASPGTSADWSLGNGAGTTANVPVTGVSAPTPDTVLLSFAEGTHLFNTGVTPRVQPKATGTLPVDLAAMPNSMTSFTWATAADAADPVIMERETVDSDANGWIDAARVVLSESVDASTIGLGWTLTDTTPAASITTTVGPTTGSTVEVLLAFTETAARHTGETGLEVAYNEAPGIVGDAAGNLLQDDVATAVDDKAVPVLMDLRTMGAGGDVLTIEAEFSEDLTAFTVQDTSAWWKVVGESLASPTAATLAGDTVTLDVTSAPGSGETPGVSHVVAVPGTPVEDLNGNSLAAFGPTTPIDMTPPAAVTADPTLDGNGDLKHIRLTFTEGMADELGGQLTAADFTYDDMGAGCAGQSVVNVDHVAGEATMIVELAVAIGTAGCEDGIDYLGFVDDKIYDTADNEVEDTDVLILSVGPSIVKMETLDQSGDGFLDGIRVTFSEPIVVPQDDVFSPKQWDIDLSTTVEMFTHDYGIDYVTDGGDPKIRPDYVLPEAIIPQAFGVASTMSVVLGFDPVSDDPAEMDTGLLDLEVAYLDTDNEFAATPIVDVQGQPLADTGLDAVEDGAKPVPRGKAFTHDLDADGRIDAITVPFSEELGGVGAIADWAVAGTAVSAVGMFSADTVILTIDEHPDLRTDALPEVTFMASSMLYDLAGHEALSIAAGDVEEHDTAAPVVYEWNSKFGDSVAQIVFSEPVFGSGTESQVQRGFDVKYTDKFPKAPARSSVSLTHVAGESTATIAFTKAFAGTNDFQADTLTVLPGQVTDAAGNSVMVTAAAKLQPGVSSDITPPASITDLELSMVTSSSVLLNWTAPGDDGMTGTVETYDIRVYHAALSSSNFELADELPSGDIGIIFSPVSLVGGGDLQQATITGLNASETYHVAIRGVDDAGNAGAVAPSPPAITTEAADTIAPATPSGLAIFDITANSVRLNWTAPGDDGMAGGPVASYTIKVSTSAITTGNFDAATTATFEAFTPGAAGSNESIVITGLMQDTTYFFAVRATDDGPNDSGISTISATTNEDTTPPAGTLVVTSSTHPQESVAVVNANPVFNFGGLTDDESTITYYYIFDDQDDTLVDGTGTSEENTTATSVTMSGIPAGEWYIHVVGVSAGGKSGLVHRMVTIGEATTLGTAELSERNTDLQKTVKVTRDGGNNVITWTLGSYDEEVAGVQIWRATSPFSHLWTVEAGTPEFLASSYTDVDAPAGARYVVTVFFGDSEALGKFAATADLDEVPGYTSFSAAEFESIGTSASDEDDGFPLWGWIALAVGGLLLLILLIMLIVRLSRKDEGEWEDGEWEDDGATWDDEEAWDDEDAEWSDDEEPSIPATGASVDGDHVDGEHFEGEAHNLTCPECDHNFWAHGEKPLHTECPSCGVKGVLN